ncbi:cobalamin biosynthesis protein CobD [Peptostreptococcus russellii]|uniref:Cobalamin biosynthesis protein CobD n=1 Tax=Peptostreptococcus russellii TaxID=215200 RepID=A0A2P7PYQ7_9FIRM|nr:adenosylcobinamide-phosphate synthase CbiB [Peptostreptococcus russellii]PSJ30839.1 cobalamin biosynthesis protein CobD [Peptostreptococcus russellii]
MEIFVLISIFAYFMDLIVGDPYGFPHPVIYIGKLISLLERNLRKLKINMKLAGALLCLILMSSVALITYSICKLASVNIYLYIFVSAVIVCTCFSTKCLADEGKKIYDSFEGNNIELSRKQLSYIVGRDTSALDEPDIIRATVETIAENTVDGTISPMFYAFIGGPILAILYKAVNTMDSMIGYKNERYIDFGMTAARLDDIFNYIPARISLIGFTMASFILRYDYKSCIKIAIRDRKNHTSPNCAYPEAAVAGALGIELGGTNIYFGQKVYKPTIGEKKRKIVKEDILKTNRLLYLSTFLTLILFIVISLFINKILF